MQFLYFLEQLRNPVLDKAMLLITQLGDETAFLVAALIVFWCVDKQKGYFVLTMGFLGGLVNQFMKLSFRVPRPWILDPNFSVVEGSVEAAAGFSFPSGHSTSSVGTFGAIGYVSGNKLIKWFCYVVCILVPFSRMYLGVHTPADVFVGAAIPVVLIFLLRPMVHQPEKVPMMKLCTGILVLALGLLIYVKLYPFSIEANQLHNLESGSKYAYTFLGAILGLMLAYPLEKKYVRFETKARWWAQILKVVLGLVTVLAVKEGLRTPLEMLLPVYQARSVRYFLIVIWAALVWPMTFRWFSKMGEKK